MSFVVWNLKFSNPVFFYSSGNLRFNILIFFYSPDSDKNEYLDMINYESNLQKFCESLLPLLKQCWIEDCPSSSDHASQREGMKGMHCFVLHCNFRITHFLSSASRSLCLDSSWLLVTFSLAFIVFCFHAQWINWLLVSCLCWALILFNTYTYGLGEVFKVWKYL